MGLTSLIFKKKKRYTFVKNTSEVLQKMNELNKDIKFIYVKQNYSFSYHHSNKNLFDRDSPYTFMKRKVFDNRENLHYLVRLVNTNLKTYKQYNNIYTELVNNIGKSYKKTRLLTKKQYIKIETKLLAKSKSLAPATDFFVDFKIFYTSPAGKNHYKKSESFSKDEINDCIYEIQKEIKAKNTRKYQIAKERKLMTNKLRYQVLERDKHRCKICGSSANDDVQLHVDHIIPVSKNGKTTLHNLRTLCDRCNLGKSDTIEKIQ